MTRATDGSSYSPRNEGSLRAYTAVILLTLYRYGEINDAGGSAVRAVLGKASIHPATTPQGASNAIHKLRDDEIIVTDTAGCRTYGIWLKRDLSYSTIEALHREEEWAKAFIRKQKPRPAISWAPPVIKFADEDGEERPPEAQVDSAVVLSSMDGDEQVVNGHVNHHVCDHDGFSVPLDAAVLMRIIAEQAKTIRSLRDQLGHHAEDGISSELGDFLMTII